MAAHALRVRYPIAGHHERTPGPMPPKKKFSFREIGEKIMGLGKRTPYERMEQAYLKHRREIGMARSARRAITAEVNRKGFSPLTISEELKDAPSGDTASHIFREAYSMSANYGGRLGEGASAIAKAIMEKASDRAIVDKVEDDPSRLVNCGEKGDREMKMRGAKLLVQICRMMALRAPGMVSHVESAMWISLSSKDKAVIEAAQHVLDHMKLKIIEVQAATG